MNIVALTGGIGSGKTEAANVFIDNKIPVVDLDAISHQLAASDEALLTQIKEQFGPEYVQVDKGLNRDKMRQRVFSDPESLQQLNAIMHPAIFKQALVAFENNAEASYQVLDIPLYTAESQYQPYINHVLLIDCDEKKQIKRVMQRSQLTEQEVRSIIQAQISGEARIKLADTIVHNDKNLTDFLREITRFHQNYIKTCIVSE